jgi:hypothetical protein
MLESGHRDAERTRCLNLSSLRDIGSSRFKASCVMCTPMNCVPPRIRTRRRVAARSARMPVTESDAAAADWMSRRRFIGG